MFKLILRRFLEAIPVLFVIITVTFFMVRLAPGDPFSSEQAISSEAKEALNKHFGLDQPLWKQYARYLGGLVQGDMGPSMQYQGYRVSELIADKILVSAELALWGLLIALGFGILAGVTASLKPNSMLDHTVMGVSMAGICLPTFVIGPLLALFFALKLGWFYPTGWRYPSDRVLPSITLGLFYAAYIARLTRASMLEIIHREFIRTARAKGLSQAIIYLKHALKNALIPVISFLGPAAAGLVSGSFVVESVFAIPGLGKYFIDSALNRDLTMVLGMVIFYGVALILMNLVSDILQILLNPRLRRTD